MIIKADLLYEDVADTARIAVAFQASHNRKVARVEAFLEMVPEDDCVI